MPTVHADGPCVDDLAVHVEDEDVVLLVVGDEVEASVAGLDHLMAVLDGVLRLFGLTPELVHAVTELAVPDDRAVMRRRRPGLGQQSRRGESGDTGGEEGTTGERGHLEKMTEG